MGKVKGKFTAEQIAQMDAQMKQPPICPYCHDSLIRTKIELLDGSGWLRCWLCDCEPEGE